MKIAHVYRIFSLLASILTSCLLISCCLCSPTISAPAFESIAIGTPIDEVVTDIGEPYEIKTSNSGVQEYQYLERIQTGPGIITQNVYSLTVQNGQIIHKQCNPSNRSVNLQIQ